MRRRASRNRDLLERLDAKRASREPELIIRARRQSSRVLVFALLASTWHEAAIPVGLASHSGVSCDFRQSPLAGRRERVSLRAQLKCIPQTASRGLRQAHLGANLPIERRLERKRECCLRCQRLSRLVLPQIALQSSRHLSSAAQRGKRRRAPLSLLILLSDVPFINHTADARRNQLFASL